MRILHILDHSLPYFSGYGFRSDSILRAQRRMGFEPIALTSPKHEAFSAAREEREGIVYHRLGWPWGLGRVPLANQAACVAALGRAIVALAREAKPDVLHAHSPALNGLAAAYAARRLGLPWVYEIRYFEEDAAVDRGKLRAGSARYRFLQALEMAALRRASCATTIGQALRADLVARGAAGERIRVIPNGVEVDAFAPGPPDEALRARHELAGCTVIGFIGSLYGYEGLADLVDAAGILLAERRDLKLLLVGDGESMASLRARVPAELRAHIRFAGAVPHEEVRRYYATMDVLAYPRIRSRLTELTTPLKPLEAMAMARAVVASDLGGLRELLDDGRAGVLTPPGSPRALAASLRRLLDRPEERAALGARARAFVARERDWGAIAAGYEAVYRDAIDVSRRA